jgi:hypothetical protein
MAREASLISKVEMARWLGSNGGSSETNFVEMSDEFHEITGFRSEAIKYHLVQNVLFKFKEIR